MRPQRKKIYSLLFVVSLTTSLPPVFVGRDVIQYDLTNHQPEDTECHCTLVQHFPTTNLGMV